MKAGIRQTMHFDGKAPAAQNLSTFIIHSWMRRWLQQSQQETACGSSLRLQSLRKRKLWLIPSVYTVICSQDRGRPCYSHELKALGSFIWPCSCQQCTFTQDVIDSPQLLNYFYQIFNLPLYVWVQLLKNYKSLQAPWYLAFLCFYLMICGCVVMDRSYSVI